VTELDAQTWHACLANQPIAIGSAGTREWQARRGGTCTDGRDGTGRHELVAIAKVRPVAREGFSDSRGFAARCPEFTRSLALILWRLDLAINLAIKRGDTRRTQ
jgi:hypothetical protein